MRVGDGGRGIGELPERHSLGRLVAGIGADRHATREDLSHRDSHFTTPDNTAVPADLRKHRKLMASVPDP